MNFALRGCYFHRAAITLCHCFGTGWVLNLRWAHNPRQRGFRTGLPVSSVPAFFLLRLEPNQRISHTSVDPLVFGIMGFFQPYIFYELFSSVLGEPLRTVQPYTSSTLYIMKLIARNYYYYCYYCDVMLYCFS